MTSEVYLSDLETFKTSDRTHVIDSLKCSLKSVSIKKFDKGDERPCDSNDFVKEKVENEETLSKLKIIISELVNNDFFNTNGNSNKTETKSCSDIDNELLALVLIICGGNIQIKPWNTEKSVKTCSEILNIVLTLFDSENLPQLLIKRNLPKTILQIISQNLLPKTWKHFPASVLCYKWILEMITQPHLITYLQFILPPALLLVDDYVNENKIMGVECLNHIINNVTVAELQFYGHGDVIYNALMPLLRLREAEIISCAVPCLVTLTAKLEIDYGRKNITKWSRFDEVLSIYLENMELEQLLSLRNSYIKNLELVINAANFHIIRWSKRLLRIFKEYMQSSVKYNDPVIMNFCLRAVHKYLEISKPIVVLHAKNLIALLCIPLHYTLIGGNISAETKELTSSSLTLLLASIPENDKKKIQLELEEKLKKNNLESLCKKMNSIIENK